MRRKAIKAIQRLEREEESDNHSSARCGSGVTVFATKVAGELCFAMKSTSPSADGAAVGAAAAAAANATGSGEGEAASSLVQVADAAGRCGELRVPKVALMFLTRGAMPHESLWKVWLGAADGVLPRAAAAAAACGNREPSCTAAARSALLQGGDGARLRLRQHLFSLYIHPGPDDSGYGPTSLFHGRVVPNRVQVRWGEHSMVEAMRALLRAALDDPANQRFQLLCEHTLPLQPPLLVYAQLMSEPRSRVNACAAPGNRDQAPNNTMDRWTPAMLPAVTEALWRKSPQWVVLNRKHAELAAADTAINAVIRDHCTVGYDDLLGRERDCYSDEHFVPVLLAAHGLDNETTCAGNTMSVLWSSTAGKHNGKHPRSYGPRAVTIPVFQYLRQGLGESRAECTSAQASARARDVFLHADELPALRCPAEGGGAWDPERQAGCPLFARKFEAEAAAPAYRLLTSCDAALGIAPAPSCQMATS
ncbi:hypothetical protein WJX81_002852 [Elliptochloris bilobata]|uniref:Uncharacterized protein n=1 Tax=Elliptochloris bilobata TaxID=381761 RepID=A0AAW1QLF1_9CHLO